MKTLQIVVAPISLEARKINHQLKINRSAIPLCILPSSHLFMCIQLLLSLTSDGCGFSYRNIRYRRRPWCYVVRNQRLVWEYCAIPRCNSMCMCIPGLKSVKTNKPTVHVTWLFQTVSSCIFSPTFAYTHCTESRYLLYLTELAIFKLHGHKPIFHYQFRSWHAAGAPGENRWR